MNKIYKLLAVFMLFAALSAGSMTAQAATTDAVAQIGSNTYTSLSDAITATDTDNAVEIDLLAAVELTEEITINSNVTLDLNGCTLTTSSSITVAPGGNVVDNSETKSGLLKLGDNSTIDWTTNSQMPVYNTEKKGYAFATMTEQVYRKSEMGADAFELIFKPDFGALNGLMANGSIATKVDIGINLEWTDENGTSKTKELVYDETMDDKVKTVYAANSEYSFYIKATGTTSFNNLTITPIVKSELGTTWSKTVFNAAIEETGVTLDNSTLDIGVGDTATLTATVTPDNATDKTVTWTSSDDTVATVENGVVTGVKAGTATITATTSNGKTADCTVTVKSEYDALISAYGNVLYSEDFNNNCTDGAAVHNDKENIPEGAYYYCANDGTNSDGSLKYGGSVVYDFAGENGYILMEEAYGQMVYVKLTDDGISGVSGMKYLVVESKLQYITQGIEFKFMTRGANSSNSARIETLGVLKAGTFSKEDGTEIASITAGEWHTFTYVFDIANTKYDLYIDGEKKQEGATCRYFRGFNGSDQFRLKAASLTEGATNADIMIDDIKVYGCTTDPTAITTE